MPLKPPQDPLGALPEPARRDWPRLGDVGEARQELGAAGRSEPDPHQLQALEQVVRLGQDRVELKASASSDLTLSARE